MNCPACDVALDVEASGEAWTCPRCVRKAGWARHDAILGAAGSRDGERAYIVEGLRLIGEATMARDSVRANGWIEASALVATGTPSYPQGCGNPPAVRPKLLTFDERVALARAGKDPWE